jgi:hypothetical protein
LTACKALGTVWEGKTMPEYEDLPFDVRPDLSPYIIHLTKNTTREDQYSAFDNLISILQCGEIWGSGKRSGFIKGPNKATCFMDIPLNCLKYVLDNKNANQRHPRYEPFGVLVPKKLAFKKGCRPVLYLSDGEMEILRIPKGERWRVVKFEVTKNRWISWIHEREWRCKGNFKLTPAPIAVLVRNTSCVQKLARRIDAEPEQFRAIPKSIIPLTVLCQGLPYLK